jgi:hypothetical protein
MDENDISRRYPAKVIAPALAASAFFKPAIAQEKRFTLAPSEDYTDVAAHAGSRLQIGMLLISWSERARSRRTAPVLCGIVE